MYAALLLACAALAVAAPAVFAAPAPAGSKGQINSRLDAVDVDKILNNPRVLNNYVKCVTDKGPCTSEGKDLKSEYILASGVVTKTRCCEWTNITVRTLAGFCQEVLLLWVALSIF